MKQQIADMAMNGSGIRDAARVLQISPTTVIEELKKTSPARSGQSPSSRGHRNAAYRSDGRSSRGG
ncbi:MAG: IS1-like element transposase [Cyanobacteria bacterium P01_D01_bin.115]